MSIIGKDLFDLIKSLPSRTYRDSVEVAIALGELKSGKVIKDAGQVESTDQPSKKGGRTAVTSSVSAAAIANLLTGTHFPKDKGGLKNYTKKNTSKISQHNLNEILDLLNKIPDKEYNNMAEVEKSIGKII